MFGVSPEPAQYVAVQHAQYVAVETTDPDVEIIAPVAPAAYHLPPTLRLSRVLRVSLFGLGRAAHAYQPAAPAAADAALPSDDAV